ncbi:MAG: nucleoside deaminase [Bacilli bacterium]|nr:nucleoside deaminase [Bacilli bacterium]
MKELLSNENMMKIAVEESKVNSENNYKDGGPFGAVIVKNGKIISKGHNTVIKSKDSTAHAEINVIREASQILGTHDLSGCILYTSAEPCPMCLSAIIWANIKEVYYANTKEDAGNIGFRDDIIYEYLKKNDKTLINLHNIGREEAIKVFKEFESNNEKEMY